MKTLNRCKMKLYKLESAMADNSNIQWIAEHRDEWSRKFDEMAACREALDKFFACGDEEAAVVSEQTQPRKDGGYITTKLVSYKEADPGNSSEPAEQADDFDFQAATEKLSNLTAELTELMSSVELPFEGCTREDARIMKMTLGEYANVWNGSAERCEELRRTIQALKEHYSL